MKVNLATSFGTLLTRRLMRFGMSVADAATLEAALRPAQVAAGANISREGEKLGRSAVLLDGFAGRYKTLRDGGRQIVALHVAGDFVDLHGYLLERLDHSAVALSRCSLGIVAHADLSEILRSRPQVSKALWRMTVVDGAITREWLLGQGRRNALQRIAHLLCEIDARLRDVGQSSNGYFTLPVTQVELGDMLGLSAVHTNRVLQELRSRKLITWSGHSVQILDADGLCGLAEFDADYLAPVGAKSATMEST